MTSVIIPAKIKDDYEIVGILSKRPYSTTYKAVGKKDGKIYAIKIFNLEKIRELLESAQVKKEPVPVLEAMLENNRTIMKLLKVKPCENVKKVYDVGDWENPYVVMEYLDYNLNEYVEKKGVTPRDAIKIVLDVAKGLKFVFDNTTCYCHGDISPDNIFISVQKGEIVAKLGDFDGARFPGGTVSPELFNLVYRPHEQEPDKQGRYDVYSLGIILAELIVGKDGARRIRDRGGEAIGEFPWVSEELKKVIKGAAALLADKRFTLEEFINALETLSQPLPWDRLEKEVKDVAFLYKNVLEKLRYHLDSNKFFKIKYDIDPKFDELAALWGKKLEESIPRIEELISYLKKELSSLL